MPIKVLHIIKSLGLGGAEMLLPETLSAHDRAAFSFSYAYFLPWKNQLVPMLEAHQSKVYCFESGGNLSMLWHWRRVYRLIRETKPNLIHCHLPWAGIVGRLAGRAAGVPVVYTEHNKLERYHTLTR